MKQRIKSILDNSTALRFALTGSFATLIDFGGYALMLASSFSPVSANYISTTIAFIFSFFANKNYTFQTKGSSLRREITLFIIVTLFGLWAIQPAVIWGVIHIVTPSELREFWIIPIIAKLIATGFSLTWNYLLYSRIVFVSPTNNKLEK